MIFCNKNFNRGIFEMEREKNGKNYSTNIISIFQIVAYNRAAKCFSSQGALTAFTQHFREQFGSNRPKHLKNNRPIQSNRWHCFPFDLRNLVCSRCFDVYCYFNGSVAAVLLFIAVHYSFVNAKGRQRSIPIIWYPVFVVIKFVQWQPRRVAARRQHNNRRPLQNGFACVCM